MLRLASRLALLLAVALVPLGCVLWPEGAGPGAAPVALADALERRDRGEAVIIDVRSRQAFSEGHIPGALNIAVSEIEGDVAAIRRMDRTPILYCG